MDWLATLISPLATTALGGLIGYWASKKGFKEQEEFKRTDKIKRTCRQLKYLVDLYKDALHPDIDSQEEINSAIWTPEIFIYEKDYKSYLNYFINCKNKLNTLKSPSA